MNKDQQLGQTNEDTDDTEGHRKLHLAPPTVADAPESDDTEGHRKLHL